MEKNKKIRWGITIISMFFIGLAVDYFFLHFLFQLKEPQNQESPLPQESPTTEIAPASFLKKSNSAPMALPPQEASLSSESTNSFQQPVEECLGSELASHHNSRDLLQQLEREHPVLQSQLHFENTHLRLFSDGSERRLHLLSSDNSNSKNNLELRYYKLDEEGLPERLPLKSEQSFNPSPNFINYLKSQGQIIFHQTKESKTLADKSELLLTTVNGQVYEFQYFSQGNTLSCHGNKCYCAN